MIFWPCVHDSTQLPSTPEINDFLSTKRESIFSPFSNCHQNTWLILNKTTMITKTFWHRSCGQPYNSYFIAMFVKLNLCVLSHLAACSGVVMKTMEQNLLFLSVSSDCSNSFELIVLYFILSGWYTYISFYWMNSILAYPKVTPCCIFFQSCHIKQYNIVTKCFALYWTEHPPCAVYSRWSVLLPLLLMTEAEREDFKRLLLHFFFSLFYPEGV